MSKPIINRVAGEPVYLQLGRLLEEEIERGYKVGDCLPSEPILAERFGVSRVTLRRAVETLMEKGIVRRQHGRGTFVLPRIEYSISSKTRFTRSMEELGREPVTEVLAKRLIPATNEIARAIGVEEGSQIVYLELVRAISGAPFCQSTHFFHPTYGLPIYRHYHGGSLHDLIERHTGAKLYRSSSRISAVKASAEDTKTLMLPQMLPILRVKSLNRDMETNEIAEYVITLFRGDMIEVTMDMANPTEQVSGSTGA